MHTHDNFIILGAVGDIEARLTTHEPCSNQHMALICHPHSLHGGSMDNKVITTVARAYAECAISSVRFNFRGVGNSAGEYAAGIGETADTLTVLQWIQNQFNPETIDLIGFSFGAFVAYRAATRWPVARLISIAPPIPHYDFSAEALPECPWSIIQPEADEVIDPIAVFAWIDNLAIKPEVYRFAQTSHFFHGKLIQLREQLIEIIQND